MRYIVSLLVSIGDTEVVLQVGNSKAGPDLTLVGLDCAVRAVFVELCLEYDDCSPSWTDKTYCRVE